MKIMLEDTEALRAKIKVVGVGGGGGNAINNMIRQGLAGVEFIAANTDAQDLAQNLAPVKIQLGPQITRGLGAGMNPEVGRKAAEAEADTIREHLEGADMVFIAAGMGGGTGTGAAPVIAEIAHKLGALTVAVVTKPFHSEGQMRMRIAEDGIRELVRHVDTLIVLPNQKLVTMGAKITFIEAFKRVDEVVFNAVRGISDLITQPGYINVDFADVRAVMAENRGLAMMGMGTARGEGRAAEAAQRAISSPFLEDVDLHGARGVLVNITAHPESLGMLEFEEAMQVIHAIASEKDARIIAGAAFDESIGDEVRVTVVATGFPGSAMTGGRASAPRRRVRPRPIAGGARASGSAAPLGEQAEMFEREPGVDSQELELPAFLRRQAD